MHNWANEGAGANSRTVPPANWGKSGQDAAARGKPHCSMSQLTKPRIAMVLAHNSTAVCAHGSELYYTRIALGSKLEAALHFNSTKPTQAP